MFRVKVGRCFAAALILLVLSSNNHAAEMTRLKYNNHGLTVKLGVGLWAWPLPMDYDNDGDYDMIVSCPDKPYRGLYFFENTSGNVKMPIFEPARRIGNTKNNLQISYVDGKERIVCTNQELVDIRKYGIDKRTTIYPKSNIHETKGRIRANQWKYCDYEGDGDIDIIVGVGDWTDYGWDNAYDKNGKWLNGPLHGYVYLIENIATTEKPQYKEPVKIEADGKVIDVYGMPSPNLADFDNDGDLDIMCGEFIDKLTYFENIGSRNKPVYKKGYFLKHNNKPITVNLCMFTPVALDWDKDGDVDIIAGEEDGTVIFIENTGKLKDGIPAFLPPVSFLQKGEYVKYGALVTPYSFDWDSDGDEDLICGNTAGNIGFIENLGEFDGLIRWAEPVDLEADGKKVRIMAGYNGSIQGPCETKWGYTAVNVADWDNDGLPDIIINSILGKIQWFKNIGTKKAPVLSAIKDIEVQWQQTPPTPAWNWNKAKDSELIVQWRTTPLVTDYNNDGLCDMLLIDHEGYLSFFERYNDNGQLKLMPGKRIFEGKSQSVFDAKGNPQNGLLRLNNGIAGRSGRRKFCLADWNNDGKQDLLVNSVNINFLQNISEKGADNLFADQGKMVENILAGHTTCPTVVDWDKNGLPDLLAGAEDGFFYYLPNPNK
ncbi:MAG: FG-GAP repeat domain-containing protein [Sedimentisphaeraceae bacterium JB056]